MNRVTKVGLGLAVLGMTLAACGDDGGTVTGEGSGSPAASGSAASGSGSAASGSGSAASGSGTGSAAEEGGTTPAFSSNEADSVVRVTAVDYQFELEETAAEGPKVFFEVHNAGDEDHEFEVLDENGDAVDEIEAFGPSQTRQLALELEPGRYTLQCLVETEDGQVHADLGMTDTFPIT